MLAAKKKKEAAAAVAAATGAADGGAGSGAAAPGTDGAEGPKKISLMGGDDARAGSGASGKRKMSPGEIRIQKGNCCTLLAARSLSLRPSDACRPRTQPA